MAPIKLKKIHWTKKRFVRSNIFNSSFLWFDHFNEMKEQIAKGSLYQRVERSCHIECSLLKDEYCVLIEVVGVLNERFSHQHFVEVDIYSYDLEKELLENGDFEEVKRISKDILAKLPESMADLFHLVVDHDKLALHFFKQKDYSQI